MRKSFQYLRPSTVEEAVQMKSKHGTNAMFWAGGTDMMLLWRGGDICFDYCINLSYLSDLDYVDAGKIVARIGPMTSLDTLDRAADGTTVLDILAETARLMCTPQTRTLATIGGNICRAAPSADLSQSLLALGAEVKLKGPKGDRTLPLEEFFTGPGETSCQDDELLVEILVPVPQLASSASYQRGSRTVVDISLVGSAVMLLRDGKIIHDARIALGAVAPTPIRARAAEEFIRGKKLDQLVGDELERLKQIASNCASPISDVRSGADYRRKMSGVLTRRAVENCIKKLEVQ